MVLKARVLLPAVNRARRIKKTRENALYHPLDSMYFKRRTTFVAMLKTPAYNFTYTVGQKSLFIIISIGWFESRWLETQQCKAS